MQFDESSDRYKCCCECFHVKTTAIVIGVIELCVIFGLLINSLVLLAQLDNNLDGEQSAFIWGSRAPWVLTPLIFGFVSLFIAFFAVCFLFLAVVRRQPYLLIPHLAIQCIAIVLLLLICICGLLAVITHRVGFYRLLNAVDFRALPSENTVNLSTADQAHIYTILFIYGSLLIVECWFGWLVWQCYLYFSDRRRYMKHCLEYSTPMRTVPVRVPQFDRRNNEILFHSVNH